LPQSSALVSRLFAAAIGRGRSHPPGRRPRSS
jgi:hypothetical protein